jgi:hypothetical protein
MVYMFRSPAIGKEHASIQGGYKADGSIPAEVIAGKKVAGGIENKK